MDQVLPEEISPPTTSPGRKRRARRRHTLLAGGRRLPILELKPDGFVIAAEHGLHLPGYVDIMRGKERLARRLVICAWAEHGMLGYEYKQENLSAPIAADHAPGDLPG